MRLACAAAGAVHVPADQLPAALHLAPAEWEAAYRCAKPGPDTWLVLQSRTCQRAAWAAQARARMGLHQGCSEPGVQQGSELVVQRARGAWWSCAHVHRCGACTAAVP